MRVDHKLRPPATRQLQILETLVGHRSRGQITSVGRARPMVLPSLALARADHSSFTIPIFFSLYAPSITSTISHDSGDVTDPVRVALARPLPVAHRFRRVQYALYIGRRNELYERGKLLLLVPFSSLLLSTSPLAYVYLAVRYHLIA